MKLLDLFYTENVSKLMSYISPVLINSKSNSVTLSLSKRFVLFQILEKLVRKIEDDPYLNFISVLKNYKVLGKILTGSIYELHRDRNQMYFKNFFADRDLWKLVKDDLEWCYKRNKNLKITITRNGVVIYDNYKKNDFNVLLFTIHSGVWMPKDISQKQTLSVEQRLLEEDIDTHKIYSGLVLEKGGIWIDNKFSRFACDFNREPERAIYENSQESWIRKVWDKELTIKQRERLMEVYNEFYFTIQKLVDTYRFNIIFDGHSMRHLPGRPEISFGTKYISKFYMPIVNGMRWKLRKMGYETALNKPYPGGYILKWIAERFSDLFIFSIEVNKNLYMTKNRKKVLKKKKEKLSNDILQIFDIEPKEEMEEKSIPKHPKDSIKKI